MDEDRRRTLAAITVIIGFILIVIIIIGIALSGKKVISPVPDDDAIRIIFVSPSPYMPIGGADASVSATNTTTPVQKR